MLELFENENTYLAGSAIGRELVEANDVPKEDSDTIKVFRKYLGRNGTISELFVNNWLLAVFFGV